MNTSLTKNAFQRTVRDFRSIAGENGPVRFITSCFYFFGSELATLRLLAKYRDCKHARQGYSDNLRTHFFSLETDLSGDMDAPAEDGAVTLHVSDPLALLRRADVALGAILKAEAINPHAVRARPDNAAASTLADDLLADIRKKLFDARLRDSAR